jgi:hypothetical protein
VLVVASPARGGSGCDAPLPHGVAGLAETIYVKGSCGTLALRPDGTIAAARPPSWAPAWAKHALARTDAQTYIAHPRGHLVLFRHGRTLWRSRAAHGSDDVALDGDAIAFTAYRRRHPNPDLWLARVGKEERLVARNEDLDGATRAGGFFTQRGRELRLRAADGRLVGQLGRVSQAAYDRRTRTLVAITSSQLLVRSDGAHSVVLADLRRLRAPGPQWLELLSGGLIKIGSQNQVLFLGSDGRRFASTVLSRKALIVSDFVTLPHLRGVAFVAQESGADRVLLLERGHRVAQVLYTARGEPRGCGYWANLSSAGDELLFWPSTGRGLAAIDVAGRSRARNLWPLVHGIPGFRRHGRIFRAAWASAWNS